ncbi:hypothetical protein GGX14DRAFT_395623 [Mycena pura]|uniref:Uncharacterized protein n=1 Tax=Mycena pura TaxID=153505 RepID=A0AAD6VCH5_9AGAR|nr:hypothetical protein GGX14DRAFT_395623 [Mycena pura]
MSSVPLNTRHELRRRTRGWLGNLCFRVLGALFDDSLNTLPPTFPFSFGAVRKRFRVTTGDGSVTTLAVSLEFGSTMPNYVSWQVRSDADGSVLADFEIPRAILYAPSRGVNISAFLVLTALRRSVAAGRSVCLQSEITYQPVGSAHDPHQQLRPVEQFWLRVYPPLAGPNPDRKAKSSVRRTCIRRPESGDGDDLSQFSISTPFAFVLLAFAFVYAARERSSLTSVPEYSRHEQEDNASQYISRTTKHSLIFYASTRLAGLRIRKGEDKVQLWNKDLLGSLSSQSAAGGGVSDHAESKMRLRIMQEFWPWGA